MAGKSKVEYDIIVSASQGNMIAMGYILEHYSPQIEATLRNIAPWLTRECIEDCKQEVIRELIRVIPKFDVNK